jgi:hypothetical protein
MGQTAARFFLARELPWAVQTNMARENEDKSVTPVTALFVSNCRPERPGRAG